VEPFRVPIRQNLRRISPYVPGKPIEEVERELGITGACKIASNENPLGTSPLVLEALRRAALDVHRYPDGSAFRLRKALSGKFGRSESTILLGNGSNELLVLLAQAVLEPGDQVVFATPSFVVYPLAAQLFGAAAVPIPLKDHAHDLQAFSRALTEKTRLVFVCNPNNPTGTAVSRLAVEALLRACPPEVLVVLDEAYYEYVEMKTYFESLDLLESHPNLAVLRTFSKVYGLAGLRVGYGFAHPDLADALQRIRQPFNVNSLALAGAEAALQDQDHVRRVVDLNARMRSRLTEGLKELGIEPAPSQANFVYFKVAGAAALYDKLLKKGVIVRPMGPEALRVTTGTEEETERFLAEFRSILR
jgi:histidinol-phosphate aminotransferase